MIRRILQSRAGIGGLVLAIAVVLSSVDEASCQGPGLRAPPSFLSLDGVGFLQNNSRVDLSDVGLNSTRSLRCNTDLRTCCNNGTSSGRWVAVGRSGDYYKQRLVEQGVELHSVDPFTRGNFRCEIDTEDSIAIGGPRDILYVSIFQGGIIVYEYTNTVQYDGCSK